MRVSLIIPSLDRAAQLDCFLRSLLRYWYYKDLNIQVLYKYSSPEYEQGYYKCFEKHPYIQPSLEYDFCRQIKHFVDEADSVVGFATDDCIVYRQPCTVPKEIKYYLTNNDKLISFSLRLGENTRVQNYLTGELQPILQYNKLCECDDCELIAWRWSRYPSNMNFSYIFSWDTHFYLKKWLFPLIKDKKFESPRALEHQMSIDPAIRDITKPYISSCRNSSVFVNTINMVQPNGPLAGTKHSYGVKELNDRFLRGEIIDLRSFDGLQLNSCHEEVPLIFTKE